MIPLCELTMLPSAQMVSEVDPAGRAKVFYMEKSWPGSEGDPSRRGLSSKLVRHVL